MTMDSAGSRSSVDGAWLPDPWQPTGQIRWWSGTEWTMHVRAMPQIAAEVSFGEAVRRGFRGWRNWSGRASVTEYWWWFLFVNILSIALYFVAYSLFFVGLFAALDTTSTTTNGVGGTTTTANVNGGVVAAIVVLVLLALIAYVVVIVVPWLAVSVRRLHDTGRSGAWLWLLLVPFGSVFVLVFQAFPGTPTDNQYGAVPS